MMTATLGGNVGALRELMAGPVFGPEDDGYDEARKVWNAANDRRPAAIARCTSADDVAAAVLFARDAGIEITVRAGAHSVPGHSIADGALMIDLSGMRDVTVDPGSRRARVQGGALIAEADVI